MKRLLAIALFIFACAALPGQGAAADQGFSYQHIRNSTGKIASGDTVILIDPLLAGPGAYEGFPDTYRSWLRNPLTPLPMPVDELLKDVDAAIVTHTHLDHWDPAAQKLLPKNLPIYVQNEEDAKLLAGQGFKDVRVMKENDEFGGIKFSRTKTRHGTEAMYADPQVGKLLGDVMGVVFTMPNGKKAWLVGDSVWFPGIDEALAAHKPDTIIVNSGGAALTQEKFKDDPEIIMDKKDVLKMAQAAPNADIIAVHMDAVNHMTVDRKDLAQFVRENGIRDRVLIPFDGEIISYK